MLKEHILGSLENSWLFTTMLKGAPRRAGLWLEDLSSSDFLGRDMEGRLGKCILVAEPKISQLALAAWNTVRKAPWWAVPA